MHIKIIIGNENNFHGSCAMKWHKSEARPLPASPRNFNLSSRCGSNTNTNTCQLRMCVSVLYMCPFDLIEVFQHNYRAFQAKSTATNQRCRGGAGKGRESKPFKLIMRLSVAHDTRHTVPHTHSCGHLTLRHFVAFAYA